MKKTLILSLLLSSILFGQSRTVMVNPANEIVYPTDIASFKSVNDLQSEEGLLDGLSKFRHSTFITESGGVVSFETEAIGGGDLVFWFDGEEHVLDCTTSGRASIALQSPNDDTSVVDNYIYVVDGGTVAALATGTSNPSGEFSMLARVSLLSAATTAADGPLMLQRTSDASAHDGRSKVARLSSRVRVGGAVLTSGCELLVDGSLVQSADGANLVSINSGVIWQHHEQAFSGIASPAPIRIVNGANPWFEISGLNEIDADAQGNGFSNNDYFNIWIAASVSSGESGTSRLWAFLSTDAYSGNELTQALSDSRGYDDTSIPSNIRFDIVPIARLTMQWDGLDWDLVTISDKRLPTLAGRSGGGGGSTATTASLTSTDTAGFDRILTGSEFNVQLALDKLDNDVINETSNPTWQGNHTFDGNAHSFIGSYLDVSSSTIVGFLAANIDDATNAGRTLLTSDLAGQKTALNYTASDVGAEPALGNPASDGYVLSSTAAGSRSWVAAGAGGGATAQDVEDWTGIVLTEAVLSQDMIVTGTAQSGIITLRDIAGTYTYTAGESAFGFGGATNPKGYHYVQTTGDAHLIFDNTGYDAWMFYSVADDFPSPNASAGDEATPDLATWGGDTVVTADGTVITPASFAPTGQFDNSLTVYTLPSATGGGTTAGEIVQLTGSRVWTPTDASAEATTKGLLGIRLSETVVQAGGVYTTTGLTVGSTLYVSETAGELTNAPPTVAGSQVRIFGYALSATELVVKPSAIYLENN